MTSELLLICAKKQSSSLVLVSYCIWILCVCLSGLLNDSLSHSHMTVRSRCVEGGTFGLFFLLRALCHLLLCSYARERGDIFND